MVNLKRYSWGAKLGAFMVIVGLVFLLVPVDMLVAGETSTVEWDTNRGAGYADMIGCTMAAWHWILTPGGNNVIKSASLTVNYDSGEPTTTLGQASGSSDRGAWHFDVERAGSKVISATASFTYEPGQGGNPKNNNDDNFVLTISGAECIINGSGSITIDKVDSTDDSKLGGATFKLTTDWNGNNIARDVNNDAVANITTDGNGFGRFDNLPLDVTYFIHEVSAPAGYIGLTNPVDSVVLTLENSNGHVTVKVENTPEEDEGSIIINKSFTDGVASSGTFTFGIFDGETGGNQVETASITITDDTSGSTTVSGLTLGQTYWVEELSGPGTNQVPGAGQRISVVAGDPPGDAGTAGFVNTPGTGSITVNKMLGASLSEAITNGLTGTPTFTFSINTDPEQTVTITGAGSAAFTDLIAGNTYTITETTTGYATSVSYTGAGWTTGTSISVDILEDENSSVYFLNDTVIEVPGSITVHKMIGDGIDADTEFNFSINTDPVQTATIVGAGTATFSNIAAGTYTITETTTGFVTSVSYDGFTWAGGSSIGAVVSDGSNTNVYFLNEEEDDDPVIEIAGISEPKIVTSEPIIEVLGLTELPYTGYRSWYYILGLLLILGGGLLIQLLRRRKKVEYFI